MSAFADFCPDGYYVWFIDSDNYECRISCPGGTYLANVYDTICTDVGAGYWAPKTMIAYGDTGVRHKCADGLTTVGYGRGADQIEDCGRILHVGDSVVYLRSAKAVTPSLNVRVDNGVYYASMANVAINMNVDTDLKLRIKYNDIDYSVYDETMSEIVQTLVTIYDYADYVMSDDNIVSVNPDVYLEATDGQYIDTRMFGSSNYKYEIVYQQTDVMHTALWGMRNNPVYNLDDIFAYTWMSQRRLGYPTGVYVKSAGIYAQFSSGNNLNKNKFVFDGPNKVVSLNSTKISMRNIPDNYTTDYTMYLFTNNIAGTAPIESAKVKIYSYKVFDASGNIIQHLVPVANGMRIGNVDIKSNGMWDIVGKNFYPNMAGGIFLYGKDF